MAEHMALRVNARHASSLRVGRRQYPEVSREVIRGVMISRGTIGSFFRRTVQCLENGGLTDQQPKAILLPGALQCVAVPCA